MFDRLFRREPKGGGIPSGLYGAIVARAREPALYRDFEVPDSVDGRFEMVVLHVALALRALAGLGEPGKALGQEVFDLFCRDMDRSLREMGVGDLAVPKRMKKIGEAFYGRSAAYGAALDASDPRALAATVRRNAFGGSETVAVERLTNYIIAADQQLTARARDLLGGAFPVPDPAGMVPAASPP